MTATAQRIALIHAVKVAIAPVEGAFRELWPEADCVNLLDDSLSVDRAKSPDMTPAMHDRIVRMAAYGRDIGADGILYTCSAFGSAIEAVAKASKIPVLKPNEAMFQAALEAGNTIGMLGTFQRSIPGMEEEFRELTRERGSRATLQSICVPDAMPALQRGDADTHNRLLAEALPKLAHCDAIMLAQFSTSVAAPLLSTLTKQPILTSPAAAVRKLKGLLLG